MQGLQERSRLKMTEELRRFITMENRETVKIGVVENPVNPNVTTDFPEAVMREGADKLSASTARMWDTADGATARG